MMSAETTPLAHPGTILIPGIMHKRNISMSDDRSNYEINDTAFLDRETNDRVDTERDGEEEINVLGPGWKWDR
eukprot:11506554-Ditylum_brightwellii.AAC.1